MGENASGKQWSIDNSPTKSNIHCEKKGAGLTARGDDVEKVWGLLGADAMIKWKLMLIYDGADEHLVGQQPYVDYLPENVIEPIPGCYNERGVTKVARQLLQ